MSGEPKTLTPERFQHRHPVEAIRFTGANASDIYKFVGWEVSGDRVRLDNKSGVMRHWTVPPIHTGDWLVRRPQPLRKSEAACRPSRYVVYTDADFHATFEEPEGVPVVACDEVAELRAALERIEELLSKPHVGVKSRSAELMSRRWDAVRIARAALAATEGSER